MEDIAITWAAQNINLTGNPAMRPIGVVWREATGYEPLNVKGYGDPTSNAESMALRRAAAKFGLCLYLYGR